MTYRELVEYCQNNDYCTRCDHQKECQVFKREIITENPCDMYKVLFSEFSFDAEIEV